MKHKDNVEPIKIPRNPHGLLLNGMMDFTQTSFNNKSTTAQDVSEVDKVIIKFSEDIIEAFDVLKTKAEIATNAKEWGVAKTQRDHEIISEFSHLNEILSSVQGQIITKIIELSNYNAGSDLWKASTFNWLDNDE